MEIWELMAVLKFVLVEWHILQQYALDEKNSDLSALAVVSALGDRQDQGERKSFTGKNFEIANTAKELGLVEIDLDLLLVGRETRPLAEALLLHHSHLLKD